MSELLNPPEFDWADIPVKKLFTPRRVATAVLISCVAIVGVDLIYLNKNVEKISNIARQEKYDCKPTFGDSDGDCLILGSDKNPLVPEVEKDVDGDGLPNKTDRYPYDKTNHGLYDKISANA